MKARVAVVAASGVLVLALAGWAGISSAADDLSGTVTMWAYPLSADKDEVFWEKTTAEFEALHPNVDVQVTVQPWANRDQLLTTAIAGGSAPDSFYIIGGQVGTYSDLGALAPLNDYVDTADLGDFNAPALKAAKVGDNLYMLPALQGSMLVVYNKKAFDATGISDLPTTWDQVREAAPKLKAAGYYTMEYAANVGTLNHNFLPYFWQAGGDLFNADGTAVAFNAEPARAALQFIKGMIDDDYVPQDLLTEQRTNFAVPSAHTEKGDVAMYALADNTQAQAFINAWGKENTVFGPPLTGPKQQISYGLVAGYAMLAGAQDKAATAAWLSYITSKDVVPGILALLNGLPARQSLSGLYPEDSPFYPYVQHLQLMRENDQNPKNRAVMTVLEPQIQAVLIGEKSVDQALSDAEAEANTLLGK